MSNKIVMLACASLIDEPSSIICNTVPTCVSIPSNVHSAGSSRSMRKLSQDATGSRGQVQSVLRRQPNDESETTAATDCMIFTNADPRYAGRLDDKQDGDTIVTIQRVRGAITFNSELASESTWLGFTLEQMGFSFRPTGGGEHEQRAENLDSSQRVRDNLGAYPLAPAITDCILGEN